MRTIIILVEENGSYSIEREGCYGTYTDNKEDLLETVLDLVEEIEGEI